MLETVAAAASDAGHELIIQMLTQATTNIYWVLGVLVVLIIGSYAYTWQATSKIADKLDTRMDTLETNHIHSLTERIEALEAQAKDSK